MGPADGLLRFEVDDDPGAPLGFRDRLARENGWSSAYAARVYDEYRRFLVLAATGPAPVTPSDEVDQAWHLHLTYTRSYWDRLCGEVLGRPLHHGPTTGSMADDAHYRQQYAATLDRYREVFGTEPPADIWPPVAERFRDPARWQRVDTRAHVVVRRAPVVAGAAAAVLVGGLTAATARDGAETDGLVLLGVVVGIVALIVVVVVALARATSGGGGGGGGGGSSAGRRSRRGGAFFGGGCGGGGCGGGDPGDSGGGSGCGSSGCGSSGCGGGGGGGCGGGG